MRQIRNLGIYLHILNLLGRLRMLALIPKEGVGAMPAEFLPNLMVDRNAKFEKAELTPCVVNSRVFRPQAFLWLCDPQASPTVFFYQVIFLNWVRIAIGCT